MNAYLNASCLDISYFDMHAVLLSLLSSAHVVYSINFTEQLRVMVPMEIDLTCFSVEICQNLRYMICSYSVSS